MRDSRIPKQYIKYPYKPLDVGYNESYSPLKAIDEIWIALKGYCYSDENIKTLINRHNTNVKDIKQFSNYIKSFTKQAENFYNAALKINYESKPLLLYYSYLNLSKVLLLLKNKQYFFEPGQNYLERHGIKPNRNKMKQSEFLFENQEIIIEKNGIASDLYINETSSSLLNEEISIKFTDLFKYLPEISLQVIQSNIIGKLKFIPCNYIFNSNTIENSEKYWVILKLLKNKDIFEDIYDEKYKNFFKNLHQKFESVDISKNWHWVKEIFNINTSQFDQFVFLESKDVLPKITNTPPIQELVNLTKTAIEPNVSESVAPDGNDFYIYFPINNSIFINEFLSIYFITFYLSELVRYKPFQLDNMNSKKERWLIESFVQTSYIKMYRYYLAKILKEININKTY